MKKLLICPWFGPEPVWMPYYWRNVARLGGHGYQILYTTDLDWFKRRVKQKLGVECPIEQGSGKIHDYRAAFGVIFAKEIEGFDFWGHTDFDCVYGRVQEYVTDDFLSGLDIYSNHWNYMCGPWSLYRNTPLVNSLFLDHPDWKGVLENPTSSGWVEKSFTEIVDAHHEAGELNRVYKLWQVWEDLSQLHFEGEKLMDGDHEVMLAHFNRTKVYPEGCK